MELWFQFLDIARAWHAVRPNFLERYDLYSGLIALRNVDRMRVDRQNACRSSAKKTTYHGGLILSQFVGLI
jgi:hypothetical protein